MTFKVGNQAIVVSNEHEPEHYIPEGNTVKVVEDERRVYYRPEPSHVVHVVGRNHEGERIRQTINVLDLSKTVFYDRRVVRRALSDAGVTVSHEHLCRLTETLREQGVTFPELVYEVVEFRDSYRVTRAGDSVALFMKSEYGDANAYARAVRERDRLEEDSRG